MENSMEVSHKTKTSLVVHMIQQLTPGHISEKDKNI